MIQQPRKPDAIPRLQRVHISDGLSAAKENRLIDTVNRLTQGTRPVRQIPPVPRPKAKKAVRLRFQSMGPDHLECLDDGDNTVLVAKPWLIRRTPFDGQTRNGIGYVYSADDRRTATRGVAPDEEAEIQEVIQTFVIDDELWAEEPETTGVEVGGVPIKLLMQSDGRAFAKVPE